MFLMMLQPVNRTGERPRSIFYNKVNSRDGLTQTDDACGEM